MNVNRENVRKWVEGLRSGKYKQTTGRLGDRDGWCCLGVACEVAIENGLPLTKIKIDDWGGNLRYSDCEGELPTEVSEWLGFFFDPEDDCGRHYQSDPFLPTAERPGASCVEWNDQVNADFAKIADLIEATYLSDQEPPLHSGVNE